MKRIILSAVVLGLLGIALSTHPGRMIGPPGVPNPCTGCK